MASRIDKVTVILDCYIEFEGSHPITFAYIPTSQEDPFVLQVLKMSQEQIRAEIERHPMTDFGGLL